LLPKCTANGIGMPNKAKRGCAQCGVLTDSKYCAAHAGLAKRYDKERQSDPIRKLFDTVRWHWTRLNVLARNRICVICKSWAAEECDHVIPARKYIAQHGGDMNRFYDESNLQGLCKPCHSRKTATEDGAFQQ
jgi:5-methylcytosine-specific restriction protein A